MADSGKKNVAYLSAHISLRQSIELPIESPLPKNNQFFRVFYSDSYKELMYTVFPNIVSTIKSQLRTLISDTLD